jgi:hypothetical protein
VTRDDSQVSVAGLLALEQFWRSLVGFELFWDFNRLSKEEHKLKQRSWDFGPLFRDFWLLGLCNGYGDVSPWV